MEFRAAILLRKLLGKVGLLPRRGLGPWGEEVAARYLLGQGYRIEARNFRVRGGEADLIVFKEGVVVVVEVKARKNRTFGSPVQAVDGRKVRRVLQAGRAFCRSRGLSLACLRFDVLAVDAAGEGPPQIRHIQGAVPDPHRR